MRIMRPYTPARVELSIPDGFRYIIAMDELKYPIGRFAFDAGLTAEKRRQMISGVAALPAELARTVSGLSEDRLDIPYREGGWSVRQIVHHIADSHMNAFIRCKLALTENAPAIKAYDQDSWALTRDCLAVPPAVSLAIIEGLHARWAKLLESLSASDFQRTFTHPERGLLTLDFNVQLYSWHGKHHTAQIGSLRARKGWT
jgi:uncharacterized damage-inducible protein DinB